MSSPPMIDESLKPICGIVPILSGKVSKMISAPPDCLTCGACCASPFLGDGYIRLSDKEEARLGAMGLPVFEVCADPDDRIVLLGTKTNAARAHVCTALDGHLGRQVACAIYG